MLSASYVRARRPVTNHESPITSVSCLCGLCDLSVLCDSSYQLNHTDPHFCSANNICCGWKLSPARSLRSHALLARTTRDAAQTKKRRQAPRQKYCQNPPGSTMIVKTAATNETIPVTPAPTIFLIVVPSDNRGRRCPIAGGSDRLISINAAGMQVPGHTLFCIVTHCASAY